MMGVTQMMENTRLHCTNKLFTNNKKPQNKSEPHWTVKASVLHSQENNSNDMQKIEYNTFLYSIMASKEAEEKMLFEEFRCCCYYFEPLLWEQNGSLNMNLQHTLWWKELTSWSGFVDTGWRVHSDSKLKCLSPQEKGLWFRCSNLDNGTGEVSLTAARQNLNPPQIWKVAPDDITDCGLFILTFKVMKKNPAS